MQAVQASYPAFGIDTTTHLTQAMCAAFKSHGYSFVVRYLGGTDVQEVNNVLASGLAIMFVTYSRGVGWIPSAALGEADGNATVAHLNALGVSRGITVWLDLEGCHGPAPLTIAYVNAWAAKVLAAGFMPGLYVGAAPGGLTSEQLWELEVVRYWRSGSIVPEPSNCGFCMIQTYPLDVSLVFAGVTVDINTICEDWHNRLPVWLAA